MPNAVLRVSILKCLRVICLSKFFRLSINLCLLFFFSLKNMEETYPFSAFLTGFKTFFSNNLLISIQNKVFSMGINCVSPERPLSLTESRSSISIWAPFTVFNIHLSEVSPFQWLMCSEMPPALDFSFKNVILCTRSLTWIWKSGANGLSQQCSCWTDTLAAFVGETDMVEHSVGVFLFDNNPGFWIKKVSLFW